MKKILIIICLTFCCVGCGTNTKEDTDNPYAFFGIVNQVSTGVYDKSNKLTVAEATDYVNNFYSISASNIENVSYGVTYYGIVKYSINSHTSDYYAFLVDCNTNDFNYYVLINVYNGMMTFASLEEINK